ncbi:MAG: right-handed parallel beta-helix repeat-containing protein [Candidatus Omnitrophica bacterium]|nr:right-handed parallel beta-helix repeat-containing protein [Candidatus Omnitrophota bacterium]
MFIMTVFFISGTSFAATLNVPTQYSTIQAAIDAATSGDTINVAVGTYNEYLTLKSGITLKGTGGGVVTPDNFSDDSIIDGSNAGRPVTCEIISNVVIDGFTIRNGYGDTYGGNIYYNGASGKVKNNLIINGRTNFSGACGWGGGICCNSSQVEITGNIIKNNTAWGRGGGIYLQYSGSMIAKNTIYGNSSDFGGGIYCYHASPPIKNNIIDGNFTTYQDGGGLYCDYQSSPDVINNTFVKNVAVKWANGQGGAIYATSDSTPKIINNIIVNNSADSYAGGIYCLTQPAVLEYNDVYNNSSGDYYGCTPGTGSISQNPQLTGDYHLQAGSPCINAGNPDTIYNDVDGTRNDMGAYGGTPYDYNLDTDQDGLLDTEEAVQGTNPSNPDTDGDSVLDGEEVKTYLTGPLDSDSDDDGANDGVEIENETDPKNSGSKPTLTKTPTLDNIAAEAFQLSQGTYIKPAPPAIPMLDYPADSQPDSVGLVYNESNAIQCANFIDKLDTYGKAMPRAGNDHLRFRIYTDGNNDGTYDLRTYSAANPTYPTPPINPPINKNLIPIAGKVLSKLIVGHFQSGYGYPQFFDFNSNGYARFNGFVPQIVGSSYRVALHNVFDGANEDFPRFREVYYRIDSSAVSNFMATVDGEGFTGAVSMNLTAGETSSMDVTGKFFARRIINVASEPYTGLVGYSSMFWKDETDTPGDSTDEAHDCDIIVVGYDRNADGKIDIIEEHAVDNPASHVVTDFSALQNGTQLYCALENRDRDQSHYLAYASATYEKRSSYSIQLISSDIPLSFILHEDPTNAEYNDNIVINLAIKQDWPKANSVSDAKNIHYITKAYFPIDTDLDGLTDQLETLIGTAINDNDTDNDLISDYNELLAGTDPLVGINQPPVVTDIPNQTVAEGATFTTITLDNYVSDADNTDAQMTWTYSGNSQLTVSIVNRVATITIPGTEWSGSETITFKATDPGGLFASDAATFTVTAVGPRTLNVPTADYPTIQAAIDAATNGDTIEIAAGTYYENLVLNKSGITLQGVQDGLPAIWGTSGTYGNTVIRCTDINGAETVIKGFLIGGETYSIQCAGTVSFLKIEGNELRSGIYMETGASAEVKNNSFWDCNILYAAGDNRLNFVGNAMATPGPNLGGLFLTGTTGLIKDNVFRSRWNGAIQLHANSNMTIEGNILRGVYGWDSTGGIILRDSTAVIRNNIIENAKVHHNPSVGVGLDALNSNIILYNNVFCSIEGYSIDTSGVALKIVDSNVIAKNNIFSNISTGQEAVYFSGSGSQDFSYNDLWEISTTVPMTGIIPGPGNITADPLFTDVSYHLDAGSPCVDAGDPAAQFNDLNFTRNDMGIYGGPYGDFTNSIMVEPGESIQAAIDAASSGMTVSVQEGTYTGDIILKDGVDLIGESAAATIIEGNIACFEANDTIENFTIIYDEGEFASFTNPYYSGWQILTDAGITAVDSEITVRNCIIYPDLSGGGSPKAPFGKGIQIWNLYGAPVKAPLIDNALIIHCDTGIFYYDQVFGGALTGMIQNSTLDANRYGIVLRAHKENPLITNNIISNSLDGIHITYEDGTLIADRLANMQNNCIFTQDPDGAIVWCDATQSAQTPTGPGNIYEDPLYTAPWDLDYTPQNPDCGDRGYRAE